VWTIACLLPVLLATVALYGPTDKEATQIVVGIVLQEHADPERTKKWYSDGDIMKEREIWIFAEVLRFNKG